MIVLILLLAFLYYRFACYRPLNTLITLPLSSTPPQDPPPPPSDFDFSLQSDDQNHSYTLLQSKGDSWTLPSHPDYYIQNNHIFKKDQCYGKEDGYKFKASGKPLYAYIQAEKLKQTKDFQFQISNYVKKGHVFYFECHNQTISDLQACTPGHAFQTDDCFPVNPCGSGGHNQLFPDPLDKRFYNRCVNGQIIHKQCPRNHYFYKDSCREDLTEICTGKYNHYIPLGARRYIHCVLETPYVKTCPEGTHFFNSRCRSDLCVGKEDGYRVGLTGKYKHPLFHYTTLYAICEKGEPTEIVKCPERDTDRNELDFETSVFDTNAQECRSPKLCDNVMPVDLENMIVPVYEKRKYAKDWTRAPLFDSVIGYKCNGSQKIRTAVQPGNVIEEYKEVDGCTENQKIPIDWNSFFDCSTRKPVMCPPGEFFNGVACQKSSGLAHTLGKIDLFEYEGLLSPHNKWIRPLVESAKPKVTCSEPETHYIPGYNLCTHPECSQFPFLKHVNFGIMKRDGENMCLYNGDHKIELVYQYMDPRYAFKFWQQRRTVEKLVHDPCVVGERTKSGIFEMDSVLYMTCDETQPFVFCPSPATRTIAKTSNLGNYACVPKDEVYKCTIPQTTEFKYFPNEIESISARKGSRVIMDGNMYLLDGNPAKKRRINLTLPQGSDLHTIKSELELIVRFQRLPTHPINSYIENKTLKAFTDPYLMKWNRSTQMPLTYRE